MSRTVFKGSSSKATGIFVIARMVLKATVQKQSSKQSPPKVSSKAFLKTDFLKNFPTEKHLYWVPFLIKLQA